MQGATPSTDHLNADISVPEASLSIQGMDTGVRLNTFGSPIV